MRRVARRSCPVALAVLALAFGVAPATAQTDLPPPRAESLVKANAAPVSIAAGGSARAVVRLTIADGWHVNANPPAVDYNIPTKLVLSPSAGVRAGRPEYPAGRSQKFAFDESVMLVYDGAVDVALPLLADPAAINGAHVLNGRVEYQACNDQVCLAPVSVPFTVEVTVTGGVAPGAAGASDSSRAPPAADDTTAAPGDGFTTAPPANGANAGTAAALDNPIARALTGGGWAAFVTLFLIGLALNLTPCVYPMLGVTVSIFGARRKAPPPQVFGLALVYVLGICVMYSTLGVVAALGGGLFGAFLQNPVVLVAIGALLLVLSLSMFGLYEFQAPTWLMDHAGGANTSSVVGIFLSGLVVGVFAAPCIGPPIVAVLAVVGAKGDPLYGFVALFTLSLGLGFPYLLLGTFSNLLQSMPRSGEWMVWVKKVFGIVMASIGLTYVLLGLAPKMAPWVVPAALVLGGLYVGFMEKSANDRRGFRLMKRLGGTLAVALGVWLSLQLTTAASRSIAFRPYDEAALAASLRAGRPVMLDFSADWCVPCHELELQTFTNRDVVAATRGFDAYKVDLTRYDSAEADRRRRQYAIAGVPTVVFLRPDGGEVRAARVQGFMPAGPFLERANAAREALRAGGGTP